MNNIDDAIQEYDLAWAVSPDNPVLHNNLAAIYGSLKQFEKGLKHANQALKINVRYAEALNNRAVILAGLERFEDSLKDYQDAINLRPNYDDAIKGKAALEKRLSKA
jgi:tetratricopeptide (TPR) repeat protein